MESCLPRCTHGTAASSTPPRRAAGVAETEVPASLAGFRQRPSADTPETSCHRRSESGIPRSTRTPARTLPAATSRARHSGVGVAGRAELLTAPAASSPRRRRRRDAASAEARDYGSRGARQGAHGRCPDAHRPRGGHRRGGARAGSSGNRAATTMPRACCDCCRAGSTTCTRRSSCARPDASWCELVDDARARSCR